MDFRRDEDWTDGSDSSDSDVVAGVADLLSVRVASSGTAAGGSENDGGLSAGKEFTWLSSAF